MGGGTASHQARAIVVGVAVDLGEGKLFRAVLGFRISQLGLSKRHISGSKRVGFLLVALGGLQ